MFKETPGHVSLSVFRLYENFESIWLKIYVKLGRMESLLTNIPLMQLLQTMWLHLSHRWYVVKSNLEHLEHLGNNDLRIRTITDLLIRSNF